MDSGSDRIQMMLKTIIFILIFLISPIVVCADTHYMATTGEDSGTCTSGSPCLTLRYAITQMAGGDILTIADGTYTGTGNLIDATHLPPSGSAGAFTTIKATNIPCDGTTVCNSVLKVVFSDGAGVFWDSTVTSAYVKIQGIFFKDRIGTYDTSHWYFKQCAVQGATDGNTAKISSNSTGNPTYTLYEDVIAFGKGRYGFLFYTHGVEEGVARYDVCRRCVHRQDWVDDASNPMAGFNVYFSHDVALLNCIDIDGDDPTKWSTAEIMSSFSQVNDASAINFYVQGSMSINNAKAVGELTNGASAVYFTDVVGVHTAGGIGTKGSSTLNRVTLLDIGINNFTGLSPNPDSYNIGVDYMSGDAATRTINNTIVRDTQGNATNGTFAGDYFNYYSAGTSSFTPENTYTTDPYLNGLLYPVRIEEGSTLKTQGSGGGQIGAQIVNKLGADGLFYNDDGWNAEGTSIWPWPMEEWIKAQMAAMDATIGEDSMPSATRGFAAPGQSLSKYIWEYLGNGCPTGICTAGLSVTGCTISGASMQ
jgi:hypothetical protein